MACSFGGGVVSQMYDHWHCIFTDIRTEKKFLGQLGYRARHAFITQTVVKEK